MRVVKRVTVVFAFLVLVLLAITACASQPGGQTGGGEPSGTITLYTSVPQPIADKIQADFNERFPDITLEVFRAGTSEVVTKISTEKEAGAIQADLVWVAEPSTYEDFKDEDLLLQFTPEGADALSAEMKDPDGYYYAGRLINMVIGYNTDVETPPAGWQDMLNDAYEDGRVAFPTPLRSGAAEAAVRALVDQFGWEYFEDFHASGGIQVQNNSAARDQLATGELQVSALLDYIVRGAMKEGSPVDYVFPEEGTVMIPSPVAIFTASENPEAAQVFVEFVISQEGQQTLVELGDFYPVRGDVDPPEGAPPLSEIEQMPIDWQAVQENRQDTKDRWTAIFGE